MDTISAGRRLTLHLGVTVVPYRSSGKSVKALTTGDVAQFLEDKYAIMETFLNVRERQLGAWLENSFAGALETFVMGGPRTDPWATVIQQIESSFRSFISSKEAERVGIPGTPTKAALRGVNHRLAHPYASANPRRPSFRDTSLYMTSFRAWTD